MKRCIMLSMWDDIKMWFYLRLLDSEMRGYIPREEGYGSTCCEIDTERRFRYKDNFMRKVQAMGWKLVFVALPVWSHKYLVKEPAGASEEKISEKTKAIFASAGGEFKLLDYPQRETKESKANGYWQAVHHKQYEDDKERIAVSYERGNRFISWSGLLGFLYNNHQQASILYWALIITIATKLLDVVLTFTCKYLPTISYCANIK